MTAMSGNAPAIERLKRIVSARTGHHYYVDKDKLIYERARERMLTRGMASLDAYVSELERGDSEEWRRLEDAITIGETYFFRYPDHFKSLREEVLPRLVRARADSRVLRIWSVGCSNGAEPYSVAIVLRELLGDAVDQWRISLVGGDLSDKALSAARAGRYNNWALRTMSPDDKAKYFHRDGQVYVLKREFRSMVRFERQNILDLLSPTPPLEWNDFDLILCRNVLIYFSPAQAIEIADALAKRVAPDGALFLGHAEATLVGNPDMRLAALPELKSEFTQVVQPLAAGLSLYVPPVIPPLPLQRMPLARVAEARPEQPDEVERVQQLADAGAYEDAERLCASLLAQNPTSARLHYYCAILHQVTDDIAGAETELRRALYLDRSFTLAHHRLGLLLLAQGRTAEARRSLLAANRLVEGIAPSDPLPEGHGLSAGDLAKALREQLATLEAA